MKYLIVDDEPQARRLLQAYMEEIGGHQLVRLCATPVEAFEALQSDTIDFMLLDIRMPVISGPDFLRSLTDPPLVIFTTAYPDYALQGYELNVVDYLLKPIVFGRLAEAVSKVCDRARASGSRQERDFVFLKTENRLVKMNFSDIRVVEGMQNYVKVHLDDKTFVVSSTMKAMEEQLPEALFVRVHRSYIVAVKSIVAVRGNNVEMRSMTVPVGVRYRERVMRLLRGE